MDVKAYLVTGRLRLGPGDTVLLTDDEQIKWLIEQGIIRPRPVNTYELKPKKQETQEA